MVLDKLKFWKKEDDFSDLGNFGLEDDSDPFATSSNENPSIANNDTNAQTSKREFFGEQPEKPHEQSFGEQNNINPFGTPQQNNQSQQNTQAPENPMNHQVNTSSALNQFGRSQQQIKPMQQTNTQQQTNVPPHPDTLPPMQSQGGTNQSINNNDQLMLAKLDAIRAVVDSLNQRVQNIERIANQENNPQKRRYEW